MGITIGDALAVVGGLFGVCLSLWALVMATAMLFGARAERAEGALARPWRCFFIGLAVALTLGVLAVALVAQPLPLAKLLGFNAIESYVRWDLVEPERDHFDFSFYDAIVEKGWRAFMAGYLPKVADMDEFEANRTWVRDNIQGVLGAFRARGHPPGVAELLALEHPQHDLRVADVCREQHLVLSP